MLVSDGLLEWMYQRGMTHGFGVPGGAITFLHDKWCHDSRFKITLCQHEAHAVGMAMGYQLFSTKSNQYSFVYGTSGPGITNMITGLATAFLEKKPLLAVYGNCSTERYGRGGLQDSSPQGVDVERILSGVTVGAIEIGHPQDYSEQVLDGLWETALTHQQPVALSLPINVSEQNIQTAKTPFLKDQVQEAMQ